MRKKPRSADQLKMIRKRRGLRCASILASLFFLGVSIGTGWAATYYIDYSAPNDSASGISISTPWKRHPYMKGFVGTYTHVAGDVFIFKGGVTWPAVCFTMQIPAGGSPGHIDTYTVDAGWYAGGSWTRPVFDGEYAVLTPNENMIRFSGLSHITFNNLEVKRHRSVTNFGNGMFSMYGCNYIQWTNCYLHGWSLDPSVARDDASGAITHVVSGGLSMTGMVVDNCEIENSEWTGVRQNGVAIRQVNTIRFCKLHDVSSLSLFVGDVHDNIIFNIGYPAGNKTFDATYHTNIFYLDAWNGAASVVGVPAYVYNNVFHDVDCGSSPIYPATGYDATIYIYNNLVYGFNGSGMDVQIDPYGGSGDIITAYVYNNTFVQSNGNAIHCVQRGGNPRVKKVVAENNHIVGSSVGVLGGSSATATLNNNLIQTSAVALGEGYSVSNLYAPTSVSASTVDAGIPKSPLFTTDIRGASRPQGAAWDIGAYEWPGGGTASPNAPSGLRLK